MKDRVSLYPNRYKLTPVSGQADTYDLSRADEPLEAGTPITKNTMLTDNVAFHMGLGADALPTEMWALTNANFKAQRTVFNADGSITETALNGNATRTTVFNDDGSIVETLSVDDKTFTKTTTFGEDESITESISVGGN